MLVGVVQINFLKPHCWCQKSSSDHHLIVIAKEFNNFFVLIRDKLVSKITSNINPLSYVNDFPNCMVMLEVSLNEVRQIIQTPKTTPGLDEMTYNHLESIPNQFVNNYIVYNVYSI